MTQIDFIYWIQAAFNGYLLWKYLKLKRKYARIYDDFEYHCFKNQREMPKHDRP